MPSLRVKLRDFEVPIADDERFTVERGTEFDVLSDLSFAQINLPTVEADITTTVHLDHVILSVVLIRLDSLPKLSPTEYINIRRTLYPECFMRSHGVGFFLSRGKFFPRIVEVCDGRVIEQLLLHRPMKPLDFTLRLQMLDPSVDRQESESMRHRSNCMYPFFETGKLCVVIGKDRIG